MTALNYLRYVILVIVWATFPSETDSKWIEDTIKTDSDWIFITRFCFLSKVGNMKYSLAYPVSYGVENMLFYYDVPGQWLSVYQRELSCEEKVNALRGKNQFPLDESSMCKTQMREGQFWYVCNGDMDFSSARERWWFVVLSRCGRPANTSSKGMYLYYKLHMTNGDDLLHQEFSADEFYILVVDIIFLILYIKMMVLSIVCAVVLRKRQLLHTTYKMYLVAVTVWTLHLVFMVTAWGYYGTTGWEIKPVEVTGRILQTCSNIIFILMLILLAKGYTVVRGRLTNKAMLKITIFINLYIVAMVVMFIWEGVLFDPGLVLYYYESPPGYGMVTIILIGWLWFTKAAVFTLKHYSSKTLFYIAFYTFYTIWFWASPFVILIAMFAMAKWTREKSVNGVQQFIGYLGHLIFLILTLPHKANDNFPFHIRTTQIGAMKDEEDYSQMNGAYVNNSEDSFAGIGPNLDIFITCKDSGTYSDYNGEKLYRPLQHSSARPAASGHDHGDRSEGPLHPASALPNKSGDSLRLRANQVPPLEKSLSGREGEEEQVTLPPLRGTGLPSILPHSSGTTADLFRVN